jgi:hypothetical protein
MNILCRNFYSRYNNSFKLSLFLPKFLLNIKFEDVLKKNNFVD